MFDKPGTGTKFVRINRIPLIQKFKKRNSTVYKSSIHGVLLYIKVPYINGAIATLPATREHSKLILWKTRIRADGTIEADS